MPSRLFCILFFLTCFLKGGFAQKELSIGILAVAKPKSVQVIPEFGTYDLMCDGVKKAVLKATERVTFETRGKLVLVSVPGKVIGQFKEVRMLGTGGTAVLRLYVLNPSRHERVYDDHLYVTANGTGLKLINRVSIEKYVAGVVEAETGKDKDLEFYKVQAVISRTYALSNRRKYMHEGFNLNDEVDSQVYHGKCRWVPEILVAVEMTAGKVLVDSEMRLITAAFHSNSGGETVSSQAVWTSALPYLTPRRDEFSETGEHYAWSRMVSKAAWLEYLNKNFKYQSGDKLLEMMAINYEQENRQIYFLDPIFNIPLKGIRKDWKFNSTYFDIEDRGDSLYFNGRGFGHGTGLSQEGAMRMANLGFGYADVLHFYYNDVHIIDLHALEFFKED